MTRRWLHWPRSLIVRILFAEGMTILLVAVLLPTLLIAVLHRTSARYQHQMLITQAHAVADGLHGDGRGGLAVRLGAALQPIYATGYDGRAFVVVDAAGRVRAASRYGGSIPWRQAPRRPRPTRFRDGRFIGVSLPVATSPIGPGWVIVSQDEDGPGAILDDVSGDFLTHYLAILLPIILLLPLLNSLAIRRLVVRVRAVSHSAADIGAHSLHVRLDEGGVPAEVVPLVRATNRLVDRLETSFRQQGEFVANVAHELRTPLATLQIGLDAVTDPAVRASLDRQVERLSHVISQLRDLASLERLAADDLEQFDLRALVAATVAELAPLVLGHDHDIALAGSERPAPMLGSPVLIGLALTNLITNAWRHTPAGTLIVVTVDAHGTLSVEDNGPGVTPQDRARLTQRFWRADAARSDSAGIGLSIVQRIVDVHHGVFDVSERPGGGAIFTMALKLEDAP